MRSIPDFGRGNAEALPPELHRHEATGSPLGSRPFVEKLHKHLGRTLLPQKRGPRPKAKNKSRRSYVWRPRGST